MPWRHSSGAPASPPASEVGADISGGAQEGVANGPEVDKLPMQMALDRRPTGGSAGRETNATKAINQKNRAGSSRKSASSTTGKLIITTPEKDKTESYVDATRDVSGMA